MYLHLKILTYLICFAQYPEWNREGDGNVSRDMFDISSSAASSFDSTSNCAVVEDVAKSGNSVRYKYNSSNSNSIFNLSNLISRKVPKAHS